MHLDGRKRNPESVRDLLVEKPLRDELRHFKFPFRKALGRGLHLRAFVGGSHFVEALLHGFLHRRDEDFGIDWLHEKVKRPAVHGLHRHRNVAVGRKKDDGNRLAALDERLLQFHPGHPGHAVVEQKATRPRRIVHRKKGDRRRIGEHVEPRHADQKGGAPQEFLIVVDDAYERFRHFSSP